MVEALTDVIEYKFSDISLLKQALTHKSYSNELKINHIADNERLEFLGDAVLELVTSEFLFSRDKEMSEGDLSKLRASLVCEQTLAICARKLRLGEAIYLGKGEDSTGGRNRDSILSDAMEAIIGAVYLDGGYENAKRFILKYVLSDIEHMKLFYDSKTILQELIQREYKEKVEYKFISEEGPDHNKKFCVAAVAGKMEFESGTGRTKKAAEQDAAYKTLVKLKENNK